MESASKETGFKDIFTQAGETMNEFIRNTDYKIECQEIVGRKFENIGDHAGFLRDGGCSKIIELLAAKSSKT